jgi:hypothetical protein
MSFEVRWNSSWKRGYTFVARPEDADVVMDCSALAWDETMIESDWRPSSATRAPLTAVAASAAGGILVLDAFDRASGKLAGSGLLRHFAAEDARHRSRSLGRNPLLARQLCIVRGLVSLAHPTVNLSP